MSRKRSGKLPADVNEDNVYDEVDRFHMEKDNSLLSFKTRTQKNRKKEVLSVRVDDDVDYEDRDVGGIYTEIKETSNKWGKKRNNFYGTSYVDKDFGGVNDSEEEEYLDMEEKDAIERQKRQDSTLAYANIDNLQDIEVNDDAVEDCFSLQVARPDEPKDVDRQSGEGKFKRKKTKALDSAKEKPQTPMVDDELTITVEVPNDTRRAITKDIMKNKGLTARRRKDSKHARIKNRKLYDRALIRRRSQVPDVRREITKYDGEKRGIHVSTIQSIKLR